MHAHNLQINSKFHVILFLVHCTINAYGSHISIIFGLYELCPYLYSVRICPTLLCFVSFVSAHGERDHQVTVSVLQPAMYVCTIELFFSLPKECLVVWQGFYLSQLFCACFFVFMYGERKQVTASVFQSAKYVPLNSFFPSQECLLHWQQFDLSNSFVFVCLYLCTLCGRDQVTASSVACCQACTISLTKRCFLFAIYVSSLV